MALNRIQFVVVIVVALLLVVAAGTWLAYVSIGPARLTRTTTLVGPDEEAIALLYQGASLDRIRIAVSNSESPADINWLGSSLLAEAVVCDREDVVLWLLERGADPNNEGGSTGPLLQAVYKDNVRMVMLLLEYGADPDYDRYGMGATPRVRARIQGNPEIIRCFEEFD